MLMNRSIVFIGPGVMAQAMVARLIEKGGVEAKQILMSGPSSERLQELASRFGVETTTDNREAVSDAGVVILSLKPQSLAAALDGLKNAIPADAFVLSIVAGARIDEISSALSHPAVVRSMPNTPAQVGAGITVWTASDQTTATQHEQAQLILSTFGHELFVADEDYLDMATALSGTGPAYVFLFMEAMVDAGVHLGFPRRIAEELVVKTVKGSVAFYEHSPRHLARLRNQVTSPGGTSAAALYYLEKAGVRTALSRAIWAAYERSVQLGKGKKLGEISDRD
jgi:pyrroline-5-carboxylate reductase